ncbi:MAG: hypothetical protein FJZ90_00080 [Chloroflexi bacterium]|nr:hypothetical protein [Chloroflexota bacterium]
MPYTSTGVWRPHRWDDWEIELIDGNLDTVGVVDEAVGLRAVWGQYGYGDGSLALHIKSDLAALLLADGMFYFRLMRDGQQLRDLMIAKDDRGYTVSNQYVDEYIEISLSPLDAVLRDKICIDAVNPNQNFQSPDWPLDDAMKWIVDHTCGPSAINGPGGSNRVLPGLTIAANVSAHPLDDEVDDAHKMDLFQFLQKFGPTWDVDWRVRMERTLGVANQMVFETFYPPRGADKTVGNGSPFILLNDASGEIRQARRYRPATGFVNAVIAKDYSSEVTDAASVALYGRRELIADTTATNRLRAILAERAQRLGYDFTFTESEMVTVGQGTAADGEFGLGDEITIAVEHLDLPSVDEYVNQVKFQLTKEGEEEVSLVFGRPEKSLGDKVGEGGGGGGGRGGGAVPLWDPIRGLRDAANLFVPFSGEDDYQSVKLANGGGLTIVGNVPTNTITLTVSSGDPAAHDIIGAKHYVAGVANKLVGLTGVDTLGLLSIAAGTGISVSGVTVSLANTVVTPGSYGGAQHVGSFTVDQQGRLTAASNVAISGVTPSAHDVVGALHTIAAAQYQLVGATGANTLGLLTPSADVSGGGTAILRSAAGILTLLRCAFTADQYILGGGSTLSFYAASVHTWVVGGAQELALTAAALYPMTTGGLDLGTSSLRWGVAYITTLNASGTTHYIRGVTYVWPAANAVGSLCNDGSGNLSWAAPTPSAHAITGDRHTVTGSQYQLVGLTAANTLGLLTLTAGTGISISGVTVNLANTAVTPGSYGNATNVGSFTVDAQGRLTAAANVAISGVTPSAHDVVGALHTIAAAQYQLVGATGANTLGLLTPSADVSGGGTAILRSAAGILTLLRCAFTTDQYILGGGSTLSFYAASVHTWVVGGAQELTLTAAALYPTTTGGLDLGTSSLRWGVAYITTLNASGTTHYIRGVTYVWPAANASGALCNDGAGNLSWAAPVPASHNLLSAAIHGDTADGNVVRGDIITGQGATPAWMRLAKGNANDVLIMGANEPQWSNSLTITNLTAGGKNIVTHTHGLTFTNTNSGNNTDFSNPSIRAALAWFSGPYVYCSDSSDGSNPYWTKMELMDGTHTHLYAKTDTPTGGMS